MIYLSLLADATATSSDVDGSKGDNGSTTVIVAASLAAVLFVVVIVLVVVLFLWRRKRRGHGKGECLSLRIQHSLESSGYSLQA